MIRPWIVECRLIEGGSAYNVIFRTEGRIMSDLKKYKDWTILKMPTACKFKNIERAWFSLKEHGLMQDDYHYRIRNVETHETIPVDIFYE